MSLSGVTIIRNGVKLGYPFVESVRSLLPVCDEVVVAVGDSEDDTRERIAAIGDPKVRIIDTKWDLANRTGGTVLSEQTNAAMRECKGDWLFYIQADEAVNEKDLDAVRQAVAAADGEQDIEGLFFHYLHFYGSYYTVQPGRNWYRQEVRIIRNRRQIVSHGDAQGFRKDGKKIKAADCRARIYHYGWARPPAVMAEKIKAFHRLWHDDAWIEKNCAGEDVAAYFTDLGNLRQYGGDHPAVMQHLLNDASVPFINRCRAEYLKKRSLRQLLKDWVRSLPFGDHRNFIPVQLKGERHG
jgi:glycosyltransferase involved in cell wall biosynthesis